MRLDASWIAERQQHWGVASLPPVAAVTQTGDVPASLFAEGQRPILVTTARLGTSIGPRPGAPGTGRPTRMALGHAVVIDYYVYLRYVRHREGEHSHD